MIAERYNKNTDEDKLTGHFFGTLRYTSFEKILKPLLVKCIRPVELAEKIKRIQCDYWDDKITFWKREEKSTDEKKYTEIDVLLDFEEILIGIEVKYQSGESGSNQLEREAEILKNKANGREKILILLAPENTCHEIVKKRRRRSNIIFKEFGVNLSYISWEAVSDELTKLSLKDSFDSLIAEDLIKLLNLKGFETFRSFDVSVEVDDFSKDFFTSNEEVTNLIGEDYDKIIKKAFEIVVDTHKHVYLLIKLCKSLCEESDSKYEPLKKGKKDVVIHWWTTRDDDDSNFLSYESWSTKWLILPFKRTDDENSIYFLEFNMAIQPCVVIVAKFIYKFKISDPKISDRITNQYFDDYSLPLNREHNKYSYNGVNGFTKATLNTEDEYLANYIWFKKFDFSEIKADNIKEKIFGIFDKLAEIDS